MDIRTFLTIFGSVFVAELGDKTQLATMLFAAKDGVSRWQVFAAASAALVVSTALGVIAGQAIASVVSERVLHWIAGIGFVAIGLWTLFRA
jgi:putative Ca2+/H+ antiporter (TMEM165/GDT1 family)